MSLFTSLINDFCIFTKEEKIYFFSWILLLISKTTGIGGATNPIVIVLFALSLVGICIKLIITNYTDNEKKWITVIFLMSLLIFLSSSFYFIFFVNVLFVLGLKNIDVKKIIKYTFFLRLLLFMSIITLSVLNFIPSNDKFLYHGGINTGVIRYSFGYFHPNAFAFHSFVLLALYIYTYFKSNRLKIVLFSSIFVLIIYFLTRSRSFLMFSIFLIVSIYLADNWKKVKQCIIYIYSKIGTLIPIICVLICIFYVEDTIVFDKIDEFLSGRIGLASEFIDRFGITLFGSNIYNFYVDDVLKVLDPAYIVILLRCGITGFAVLLFIIHFLMKYFYKKKYNLEIVLFTSFLLYSLSEEAPIFIAYNFILLYAGDMLYKNIENNDNKKRICDIENKTESIRENIKFSLIVPVYNFGFKMRGLIDSIKNQTYGNFEVIIINDGSTDDTLEHISNLISLDDRFSIISTENFGVSHARNIGLSYARGDYICFADSDDLLSKDYFHSLNKILQKNRNIDVTLFSYYLKFIDDEIIVDLPWRTEVTFYDNTITNKIIPFLLSPSKNVDGKEFQPIMTSVCLLCIKRELFLYNNLYFDESLLKYEDMDFYYKLISCVNSFMILNEPLYYYVRSNGSTMERPDPELRVKMNMIYNRIMKVLKTLNIYESLYPNLMYFRSNQYTQMLTSCIHINDESSKNEEIFNRIIDAFLIEFKDVNKKYLSKKAKFTILFSSQILRKLLYEIYKLKEKRRYKHLTS